jgi:hypothetical protein
MKTNQEFISLVEERTQSILSTKGDVGRQAIATTRGQQVEKAAAILLSDHPNVESVVEQVFEEEVDEFSNIDLVVTTKDGRTVYVPCARDLWLGTSQQDRLQIVWAKFKGGLFDNHDVCYLCLDDINTILNKEHRKSARRGPKIKNCCRVLFEAGVIMNFEHLWNHLLTTD